MMEEDTRIVDSLVGEYAKIDRLAATILEDKQQVKMEVPLRFMTFNENYIFYYRLLH